MPVGAGQRLGRYELLRELGRGAMGVVYLARDPLIGRQVALKTFRLDLLDERDDRRQQRSRFLREAQSAGILSHPHIVTVHDVVESADEGVAFIAMEYVEGTDLKQVLARPQPLPVEFVVEVVSQAAEALDYAHSMGVVHRDIKPANIMLTADNRVKLTDFGIALLDTSNLTHDTQLLGTPNYMSPEQVLRAEVDHRTDVFSLGVVLYEMMTRRKPFQGDSMAQVTHRIAHEPFTPPQTYVRDLPPSIVGVLGRALAKDRPRRFQQAGELATALRHAVGAQLVLGETMVIPDLTLEPRGVPADADGPAPLRGPSEGAPRPSWPGWARRWAVGAALAGALAAVLGLALARARSPRPAAPPAAGSPSLAPTRAAALLERGSELMVAGDLAAAETVFAEAERWSAHPFEARRLRREARRALDEEWRRAQRQLAPLITAAGAALASGQHEAATKMAGRALAVDPFDLRARAVADDARLARERSRRVEEGAPREPPATERVAAPEEPLAESLPAPPPAPPPPRASGPANLTIELASEVSEGILTVYVNGAQVLRQAFRFVERSGLFRARPVSGRLEAVRQLAPGRTEIRVYVVVEGQPTRVRTLEDHLPPGGSRTLRVALDGSGGLVVELE